MVQRTDRVGEEIKKLVAEAIRTELRDPRVPVVTSITEVKLSKDLRQATLYLSTLGSEEEKQNMIRGMEHSKGFLRSYVARRMGTRVAPELHFRLDDSIEEGVRMSALIDQIIAQDEARDREVGAVGADSSDVTQPQKTSSIPQEEVQG